MILFRPVGLLELELIANSNYSRFPPRLPEQPIFYPVLEESYAIEIAEKWNTKDKFSGYCGFVLKFEVDDEFIQRYPIQVAGNKSHKELWVPAEEIIEFNAAIQGKIVLIKSFYGIEFKGKIDENTQLPETIADLGKS